MEWQIDFNGNVISFVIEEIGDKYRITPRLGGYHHRVELEYLPTKEEVRNHFISDPAFRKTAGFE